MKMNKTILCSKYDGLNLAVLYTEPQGMRKGIGDCKKTIGEGEWFYENE